MRTRHGWAVVVGLGLAGAGIGGGCELVAGFGNPRLGNPDGGGGSGSSSSSASSASSSSSSSSSGKPNGAACTMNADCTSGACADNGMGGTICCEMACTGGLACAPVGTCKTTCAADTDCVTNDTCGDAGTCLLPIGQPCAQAGDCASTYCTDDVCCSLPCTGSPCYACAAKLTGGVNGTCSPVKDGLVDPRGLCPNNTSQCQGDNTCVSGGTCNQHTPAGTICGGTCTVATNGASMVLALCSDAGSCSVPGATVTCLAVPECANMEGFNACACSQDADCPSQLPYCYIDPHLCIGGACQPGQKCCVPGDCMAETTVCSLGWCAAEPF
jgi:hypothetical protein